MLLTGLLLAGCVGGLKTDRHEAQERIAAYLGAHPELDAATREAIGAMELRKGMTMEEVIAAWGRPAVVHRFQGGAVQYWYFPCVWPHTCIDADEWFPPPDAIFMSRALFEDGRLVSSQM
jgi:hypothetical protein